MPNPDDPDAGALAERLASVRDRIAAAGRDPAGVTVVAVTKGFGPGAARAAVAAGLADLGENYPQELVAKSAAVDGARWHLIGAPQRNKIARLAPVVALWQAVGRAAVVDRLAVVAPGASVLVQVEVTGAPGRAGCLPGEVPGLVARARDRRLVVRGLMCVGPAGDPDGARRAFRDVASIGRDTGLTELSMGMSDDYPLAVEEGSTMVRLGRVLFGPRPGPAAVRR